MGLFAILDDESRIPKGTDLGFLEKLTKGFSKLPDFKTPKGQQLEFTIQHFAGAVRYCVYIFLKSSTVLEQYDVGKHIDIDALENNSETSN